MASTAVVTDVVFYWKTDTPLGLPLACSEAASMATAGCSSSYSLAVLLLLLLREELRPRADR